MGWIMFPHNPQRVGHSLATEQQRNSHVKVLNPSILQYAHLWKCGMPVIAGSLQSWMKPGRILLGSPQGGHGPANTLTSEFQPPPKFLLFYYYCCCVLFAILTLPCGIGFSSCGMQAQMLWACGILVPQPEIRLESLALEGRFLTTGPLGKSLAVLRHPVFGIVLRQPQETTTRADPVLNPNLI